MLKLCLTLLLGITIFYSCKKDPSPGNTTFHDGLNFLKLDWTPTEQEFFSLAPRDLGVNSRSVTKAKYHPIITEAYNQIAEENSREHFVDNLARRAGFPIWLSASIHVDAQTQETLVVVPLSKPNDHKISSFISLYKKRGDFNEKFVINGISRNRILDTLPGSNVYNKALFARLMLKKEEQLFKQQLDPILLDAYCRNQSEIINYGGGGASGPGGPNPLLPPLPPILLNCEWRYIQICYDETGSEWITGGRLPVHLDHDQDGIHNEEDPDWQQLSSQGLTQDDFTQFVSQYWHEHLADQYGSYEDFWDDGADITDIAGFYEDIDDMLYDIQDWIQDHIDDFDGDMGGEEDPYADEPPCPKWDVKGGVVEREIKCNWFYAYICDEDGQEWWEDIVDLIPYSANDASYQGSEQARFCAHWEEYYSDIFPTCDDLYDEASAWGAFGDCDIYSPLYESCLDEKFIESYVPFRDPTQKSILDPKKLIDNCFYSDSECPNCKFSVTIYIEQPVPGTRTPYGGDGGSKNGGHTFLSIQQVDFSSGALDDKIITLGFYPHNNPSGNSEVPGSFYHENENSRYNISVTYPLTRIQLQAIQNYMNNVGELYNINTGNCSTVAVDALGSAGIVLPKTSINIITLGDIEVNPADLGEDLRNNHAGAASFYSSPNWINLTELDLSTCQ